MQGKGTVGIDVSKAQVGDGCSHPNQETRADSWTREAHCCTGVTNEVLGETDGARAGGASATA